MPIANCIVAPDLKHGSSDIIELWAKESGQSADHMTINVVSSSQQFGRRYAVMANLLLPSIWSSANISLLQVGLAKALAMHFGVALTTVQIVTSVIGSGLVVEGGKEIQW